MITAVLRGGTYALMAVGLSLVFGVMHIPHFVHGEFYMLGAYTAYFTHRAGYAGVFAPSKNYGVTPGHWRANITRNGKPFFPKQWVVTEPRHLL